jgi:hypothetical protein
MELDGFCKELSIAFEHHGIQHYEFTPFFHQTPSKFERTQELDREKSELCQRHGVSLIVVSWDFSDIHSYLHSKLMGLTKGGF